MMSFGYKCIPVHATTFICTDTVIQPIVLVYKGEISVLQTNALSTRRRLSVFHWKYELNLLLQICSFLLKYFQADILLMFFLKKRIGAYKTQLCFKRGSFLINIMFFFSFVI